MEEIFDTIDAGKAKVEEAFAKPLATGSDPDSMDSLRAQIAQAETFGVYVASWRRKIAQIVDEQKREALGNVLGEAREGKKPTVDEIKIKIDAEVSRFKAYENYVEDLQDLIKRRCSLGQSLLSSLKTEQKSSWNETQVRV